MLAKNKPRIKHNENKKTKLFYFFDKLQLLIIRFVFYVKERTKSLKYYLG